MRTEVLFDDPRTVQQCTSRRSRGIVRPFTNGRSGRYPGHMAALFHPTPEQFRIENVLTALGNPTRLQAVRKLADGCEHACGTLMADVAKSTMTHHWRVLREAGLLRQDPS